MLHVKLYFNYISASEVISTTEDVDRAISSVTIREKK